MNKQEIRKIIREEIENMLYESRLKIEPVIFDQFKSKVGRDEGIVLLGTGAPLQGWIDGVVEEWQKEGYTTSPAEDLFSAVYKLTTSGGRTDLALVFARKTDLDFGKLAMWRLRFGDCSWISDYLDNYASQHAIV